MMEDQLLEYLRHAARWQESGTDFIPTLGCSKCGKGCMPLCGLGMNPSLSPMETRDTHFKSLKTMLEVGEKVLPVTLQIVTSTAIVIQYESAMASVEERVIDGVNRLLFLRPIPTLGGLICKDCDACQVCLGPINREDDTIKFQNRMYTVCLRCSQQCVRCGGQKLRFHPCCTTGSARY